MKTIVKFTFIALLSILTACNLKNKATEETVNDKPNIIIILTDDQGYADVGFNGCKDIPTPNIDRLANHGVKFTNAYVSYAVCGPSRAGLITGRYQDRFGFGRNPLFCPNDPNQGLPLTEQTLAEVLNDVGYQTMAYGKWHLGAHKTQRPLERGFDEFFGFLTGGHQYFPEKWTLNDISEITSQFEAYNTKLLKNNKRVEESEYLTDALSREAVSFIERNKDNPFFMYLAYNAPHAPLQATEKYLNRFEHIKNKKRKIYAAMVSAVDDGVGDVLNKLEELELTENTIVFFLSDNGGPEKKNGSNNGELRNGKGSLYDGGIHVPFAIQWPAKIPAGKVYDKPIISLDIFSTVVHYANAKPKNKLDGVNLIPYINGENKANPHDFLFWRKFNSGAYAVRNNDMKLVNAKGKRDELYNLTDDIGETNMLNNDIVLQKLLDKQKQWNSEMIDPVFLGLMQGAEYNKLHPKRFDLEKY